jgi:hypothetical protein
MDNNLFSDKQYGFIGGRSVTLQLLKVMDEWTKAIDEGCTIDCIYMDFMKAFDMVPHKRLLSKLFTYGFSDDMIEWVRDFVVGRKQRVRIDGILSEEREVMSGIPQGSVLGPFLFLLYINDMPEVIKSVLFLFADDSKVYRIIHHSVHDRSILQEDLEALYEWSKIWLMKIHPEKLFGMEIGGCRENPQYDYTMGPMTVRHSSIERDIGVEVDDKLSFSGHIETQVKKANMKAGWLRRTFKFLTPSLFRPLYMQVVRSQLEFAVSVWSPFQKQYIDKIEQVQERSTKMLPGFRHRTYEERLKLLNLPTLRFRRHRADMINAFKIISGIHEKKICPELKSTLETTGRAGRNSLALHQQRCNIEIRKYSFTQRVPAIWNTLSTHTVTAPSVDCFKRRIDKEWKTEAAKYDSKENLRCMRVTRRN